MSLFWISIWRDAVMQKSAGCRLSLAPCFCTSSSPAYLRLRLHAPSATPHTSSSPEYLSLRG
eukprot:60557-Chlamydomonas_euryale.AAC.2